MRKFSVNGKLGAFEVNLPESLDEISNDYFELCTSFVHPAPNYALVAIVYKDNLSLVLSAGKKKQDVNVSIIPVFIKAGETDSDFINSLKMGEKVVVAGSDLSIGHHINSPYNKITPTNIIRLCEGDKEIYSAALVMQTPVCFVEFKLIPASAIHANLDRTANSFINPFIKKAGDSSGEA